MTIIHFYKTISTLVLEQSFGTLSFSLLFPFVIWRRSYQGKLLMGLVFLESAFMYSTHLVMNRIYQWTPSVQPVHHLADHLLISSAPTELFKMLSVTMLLVSSCRSVTFGNPASCVICNLVPSAPQRSNIFY